MYPKRQSIEHKIQVAAVNFLRTRLGEDFIIYAIPNGGKRTKAEAKKLKEEGVLAGMPDLHIPSPNKHYNSLYIEVKKPGGVTSSIQKKRIEQLREWGHQVEVCESVKEIVMLVLNYFGMDQKVIAENELMFERMSNV